MFANGRLERVILHRLGTGQIEDRVGFAKAATAEDRSESATPMALLVKFAASSNVACTKSYAIRPVPVRAESLHADISPRGNSVPAKGPSAQ